ncbi:MAG: heme o synthase [Pseudomonadota bacterium]
MSDMTNDMVAMPVSWRDYYEITKPRVVMLMLLCAVVGMFLAVPGMVPLDVLFFGTLGIALVAGSAAAVNHIADATIDARMARTEHRPVAMGRLTSTQGITFAAVTGGLGFAILYAFVNPLTAWLNAASWVGYGLIYTLFLKRATPQNIVIGGLFGAAPPLFGWTAVTNSVDPGALLLVLIIFAWTPPHFWALALDRKEEYAAVNVPMLPVTHGDAFTRLQVFLYTLILLAASLLPFAIGMCGLLYLAGALALGAGFLYWAIVLLRNRNPKAPIETFKYSILYLALLFAVMLIDHYIHIVPVLQSVPLEIVPLETIPSEHGPGPVTSGDRGWTSA